MAEVDAGCHNDDVFAINPSAQRASKKPQEKKKTVKAKQELCWFHDRFDAMSCRETGIGEAPGTRCLPPAAPASGIQLLQSASSSGPGTEASTSASGSGSVPSMSPAASPPRDITS